jgi:hypothetical protein
VGAGEWVKVDGGEEGKVLPLYFLASRLNSLAAPHAQPSPSVLREGEKRSSAIGPITADFANLTGRPRIAAA